MQKIKTVQKYQNRAKAHNLFSQNFKKQKSITAVRTDGIQSVWVFFISGYVELMYYEEG